MQKHTVSGQSESGGILAGYFLEKAAIVEGEPVNMKVTFSIQEENDMVRDELLPLRAECALLFQANPHMVESIDGLQQLLGKEKDKLLPVLETLVKQGILQMLGDETAPLYRYKEPLTITEFDAKKPADSL
ncbi:hypothetical protein ACFO3D_05265 [Virgibacillus kekensis]|uniref:Uncharacterized protein n=1 Tax=Virgibacillus kekensis TaxID=202261 RepID=A0ABV9DHK2_9BACI